MNMIINWTLYEARNDKFEVVHAKRKKKIIRIQKIPREEKAMNITHWCCMQKKLKKDKVMITT